MVTIGAVESLWRYPVKSMSGEQMPEIFMGFSSVYGDRCYAFKSSAAHKGFPYLNANTQPQMLLYRPQFRYPERALNPPNLIEAMSTAPGVTPANGESDDLILDVVTPSGETLPIDDPKLIEMLGTGISEKNQLARRVCARRRKERLFVSTDRLKKVKGKSSKRLSVNNPCSRSGLAELV